MFCPTIVTDFENNLILYFFSAMPQVLGTMLALIGAFYPSRSRALIDEVRELNIAVQKKVNEFNVAGGLPFYCNRDSNLLANNMQGENKIVARQIYKMEEQESFFQEQLRIIQNMVFSEYSLTEIKATYISFLVHYHQALATFNQRTSRILENNKEFASACPDYIRPYFYLRIIGEITSLMKNAQANIDLIDKMKRSIKEVFIFNGGILVLFILSFLFLKYTSNSIFTHDIFLSLGAVLASISAYSMIYFVYNSVSEKAQTSLFGLRFREKGKALLLWIKSKIH